MKDQTCLVVRSRKYSILLGKKFNARPNHNGYVRRIHQAHILDEATKEDLRRHFDQSESRTSIFVDRFYSHYPEFSR